MSLSQSMRTAAAVLAVCALMLALATCGGGRKSATNPASIGSGGFQAAEIVGSLKAAPPTITSPQSLDDALAELDALQTPEGVDAELFAELKDALREALIHQVESRLSSRDYVGNDSGLESPDSTRGATATAKFVSTPPTGDANRVNDLRITDNSDGTYTLTWSYKNVGDYDQDGEVAVEDVIPLAEHFGESYEPEDENCLQAVIDGSGSGRIGIEDVTPIAMRFTANVHHYAVEGAAEEAGLFEPVSEVTQDAGTGEGRLAYSVIIESPAALWHRVVPGDSEGAPGEPSNAVLRPSNEPIIYDVSPTEGYQHEEYTFSATVTGAESLEYAWDFGGGANPDTSAEPSPTVTLADAGEYAASLTVTNAYGEAFFPFILTVSARDMWAHTWGGWRYEGAEDIAVDDEGNVYILAYTSSFGAGSDDVLVLKYAPNGEILWAKTWGTETNESPAGCELLEDGLLVVGHTYISDARRDDVFFLKYSLEGNLLWQKTWGTGDYERVSDMTTDDNGNIYVVGEWVVFGGQPDMLVAKFAVDGESEWSKRWHYGPEEYPLEVVATLDGAVYLAGYLQDSGTESTDALIMKYTREGSLTWVKSWDGGASESIGKLLLAPDGHVYAGGKTYLPATEEHIPLLFQLDYELNFISVKRVPGSGSLQLDREGNIYGTGSRRDESMISHSLLFKYDCDGILLWGRSWTRDWAHAGLLAQDRGGNLYLAGSASANAGSWEETEGHVEPVEGTIGYPEGIEQELVGTEGVIEGTETFPEGVEDTGGDYSDVLLMKNFPR